jgi:hypothetical protein
MLVLPLSHGRPKILAAFQQLLAGQFQRQLAFLDVLPKHGLRLRVGYNLLIQVLNPAVIGMSVYVAF